MSIFTAKSVQVNTSIRVTIPKELVEYYEIKRGDFLEIDLMKILKK